MRGLRVFTGLPFTRAETHAWSELFHRPHNIKVSQLTQSPHPDPGCVVELAFRSQITLNTAFRVFRQTKEEHCRAHFRRPKKFELTLNQFLGQLGPRYRSWGPRLSYHKPHVSLVTPFSRTGPATCCSPMAESYEAAITHRAEYP